MRLEGTSQFSIHPLKGVCKPAGVYRDLYPASVCLSAVTTYFAQGARDRIVSKVRERVEGCESFAGISRSVYGGLCGALEDFDMSHECVQDLLASYEWKPAYFPATFPNEDVYAAWRKRGCPEDANPLAGGFWESTLGVDGWMFVEAGRPSPTNLGERFSRADFALLLGTYAPKFNSKGKGQPQWSVLVHNPT